MWKSQHVYTNPIPAKLIIGDKEIDVIIEKRSYEEVEREYDCFSGQTGIRFIDCKETFTCTREFTK